MSQDMDARQITLNYEGGSLTMSVGNAKSIFGDTFSGLDPGPEQQSVSVKSHSRVRVIGQPAKTVAGYTYEYQQWPTSTSSNAAAGTVILMDWQDSNGSFTARVSGSMAAAASFFQGNAVQIVQFRTQRGTKYGPFAKSL